MGGLKFLGRSAKGGVLLSIVRNLTPNFAGKYQGALDLVATGAVMKVTHQGGAAFIEVGAAQAISNLVDDFVWPNVAGFMGTGSPMAAKNGGFSNALAIR